MTNSYAGSVDRDAPLAAGRTPSATANPSVPPSMEATADRTFVDAGARDGRSAFWARFPVPGRV
ncbi:MAG TPA: hypothetical protein DIT03_03855 [Candidatus Accumulibacter sp.]|nr:hypothetical protein [Accumulibacter sp.]HCN67401.1 hypothetical protein [Accumulibacter sp.]